ncbi:MAG TPA: endolytic transglycosylase MltG, partial [Mycobacteriales bacterium]|nr:endolytic transglycosylase MltG [Mycobacteriales bacterium]
MLPADLQSPPKPPKVRLTRRGRVVLLLGIALVVAAVLGVGAVVVGKALHTGSTSDYAGPGTGRVVVQVQAGDSATAIAKTLKAHDVIRSSGAFVDVASNDARAAQIQPGFYALREKMSAEGALTLILDPSSRVSYRVTVPEGTSLKSLLPLLSKGTKITAAELQAAIAKPSDLGLPAYANGSVEGFLFPATYDVPPNATATELLTMMTKRFAQTAQAVDLVAGAQNLGFTPLQVVTIASIIERESAAPADAAKVARVFYNRLAAGMPLGSEFTVRYSGNDDSNPYNTYTHTGFPPGPYDSPGEATL